MIFIKKLSNRTLPRQLNQILYLQYTGSSNDKGKTPFTAQGFQGQEHRDSEFHNYSDSRQIINQGMDLKQSDHPDGVQENISQYDKPNVSLYSAMQSNVPDPSGPFEENTNTGSPTHLNMPGGGLHQREKFIQGKIKNTHPNKNFSTIANDSSLNDIFNKRGKIISMALKKYDFSDRKPLLSSIQDSKQIEQFENIPCPQGVQGMDCEQFKLWLNNCTTYGLDCKEQLSGIQNGRLTLKQVLTEQDEIIERIAFEYKSKQQTKDTVSKNNNVEQLKLAIRDYGATVVIFHISLAVISLGSIYTLVWAGLPIQYILNMFSIDSALIGNASTFVIAYAIHKSLVPIRIGITLACAPFIVKFLRSKKILE